MGFQKSVIELMDTESVRFYSPLEPLHNNNESCSRFELLPMIDYGQKGTTTGRPCDAIPEF